MGETVRAALARVPGRWSDEQYLTRVIVSEFIKDDIMGELGFGIGAEPGDTGDGGRIVDVDTETQTVTLRRFDDRGHGPFRAVPFTEYART